MSDVKVVSEVARGGLLITPQTKTIPGGAAAEFLNYEVDIGGGYRRIAGYERFDGKVPPSAGWSDPWEWDLAKGGSSPNGAQWDAVDPVEGNLNESVTLCIPLNGFPVINGLSMPEGGEFALFVHDNEQPYQTGQTYTNPEDFLAAILAMPGVASAEFVNESLCIVSDVPGVDVIPRLEVLRWVVLDNSRTKETFRTAIGPPQGFGPIYGIAVFKGCVICCRNFDESGDDSRIYRSTPNGWEQIPTLPRIGGSEYSFVAYNFYGDPQKEGLYGADGLNKAFEISGEPFPGVMKYTEIDTVLTVDADTYYPRLAWAHSMHLFLSFRGGWVQYSGIGDPFSDDPNDGAGGIAYPDEVTNMVTLKDDAFAIMTREEIYVLYGKSEADWSSAPVRVQGDGIGAIPKTARSASGKTFVADRGGIFSIDSVPAFGNFLTSALSRDINSLYQALHPYTIGSVAIRTLGIYRVYYSAGEFISMTFGPSGVLGFGYGKLGFRPKVMAYGTVEPASPNYIRIAPIEGAMATEPIAVSPLGHSSESNLEAEVPEPELDSFEESVFIGSEDGMVYRMDKDDSFDGAEIPAALRFHFHDAGNMRQRKRWRKAVVEFRTPSTFPLKAHAIFDYGAPAIAVHDFDVNDSAPDWGIWESEEWGEFYWLDNNMSEGEVHINGQGRSVSLLLYGRGRAPSFVVEGYTLHYSPRGLTK
jgi:hypothetical protein